MCSPKSIRAAEADHGISALALIAACARIDHPARELAVAASRAAATHLGSGDVLKARDVALDALTEIVKTTYRDEELHAVARHAKATIFSAEARALSHEEFS